MGWRWSSWCRLESCCSPAQTGDSRGSHELIVAIWESLYRSQDNLVLTCTLHVSAGTGLARRRPILRRVTHSAVHFPVYADSALLTVVPENKGRDR